MDRSDFPAPTDEMIATNFIVAEDIAQTEHFYTHVLGGEVVFSRDGAISFVKLANTWVIISTGGGPTPDKPNVTLETPSDPDRVNAFMNLRVADIHATYREWTERGAEFLTEPIDNHGMELRCYVVDPDNRIIEVGQHTGLLDLLD